MLDELVFFCYTINRYIENRRMALFWDYIMVKPTKKAILYEHMKIYGGLIAALCIVAGIAVNVFTLPQRVTVVETKVSHSETRLALLEAKLDSLIADNKEIKADIKEILRKKGN